jgi:uncharacterized RDD family membrane protein YckC
LIYCAHCGAANPPEARFCYRCGQPILRSPDTTSPAPIPATPLSSTAPTPVPAYNPPAYGYTYPAVPPPPGYGLSGSEVLRYHPLAEGVRWLPGDLQAQPRSFYSYVNSDNRLVFARRAGFWKRFLAAGLDLLVLLLPILALSSLLDVIENNPNLLSTDISSGEATNPDTANPLVFVYLAVILAYFYLTGLRSGQSIGKKAQNLRVMRLDGRKPDWLTAGVRYLAGYLLSSNLLVVSLIVLLVDGLTGQTALGGLIGLLAFGWGFWWAGWDELKQGWHDKLARTLVVDTREYVEGIHFVREPLG